jgi:hypothetical protein
MIGEQHPRVQAYAFRMTRLFDVIGRAGPDLLLRHCGRAALPVLQQHLLATPEGRALVLDLRGVQVMDTSFADETIVALMLALLNGEFGDRFLIVRDPSPETLDNLEGTIARRKERIALLVHESGATRVLGHIERNLAETWAIVSARGTLTARVLADRLDIEIQAASTRLHRLYQARLLARREDVTTAGRQHIYSIPQ